MEQEDRHGRGEPLTTVTIWPIDRHTHLTASLSPEQEVRSGVEPDPGQANHQLSEV